MCALFKRNGKTPVIGIDLGSGFIKMAQFKETSKGLSLVNFGLLPVPEGAIQEGRIIRAKEVADSIKELLKFHSFMGNRIVAAVSGQLVIVKELLMENLPDNELSEAIKWEMEKFLPFAIDKAIFDYQILSKVVTEEDGSEKLDILSVAAPLEAVQSIVDVLKSADLDPVAIEVEAFSELRLLKFIPNFDLEKNDVLLVVVNIGHNYTSLNMIDSGIVRFSRTLPLGGKKLTEAIAQYSGKSFEEAEAYKKEVFDLNNQNDPVVSAVEQLINSLSLEIKRSIDFYYNKYNEGKTMKTVILLEGGSANLKGLSKYIEESTGHPTGINKLFTDIAYFDPNLFTLEYLQEMAPIFSISTGLALREHSATAIKKAKKMKAKTEEKPAPKKSIFKYKKG